MQNLPECQLFKGEANEYSACGALYCVGPHYAAQIRTVTRSTTLGGILQYLSRRTPDEIEAVLQRCARNARAGEVGPDGKTVATYNVKVIASLVGLLRMGLAHPEYFSHHPGIDLSQMGEHGVRKLEETYGAICVIHRRPRAPAADAGARIRESLSAAAQVPEFVDAVTSQVIQRLKAARRKH